MDSARKEMLDRRKKVIHAKLKIDISEQMDQTEGSHDLEKFDTACNAYIPKGILASCKTVIKKLDALEKRCHLQLGEYTILKTILTNAGLIDIIELVEKAEKEINDISSATEGPKEQTGENPGTSENRRSENSVTSENRKRKCSEFTDLQTYLKEIYMVMLKRTPVEIQSLLNVINIRELYEQPNLVEVDHRVVAEGKKKEEKKIPLKDLFKHQQDLANHQQIYVCGEAGTGKTSLCKQLMAAWCDAHDTNSVPAKTQSADYREIMSTMQSFEFLFYISLRDIENKYTIRDMIVSQLVFDDKSNILDRLLNDRSEKCLVILDGLDEWTSHRSHKLPVRDKKYTTLTTCRPWKMEIVTVNDIDQKIELRGVDSVDDFGRKLVGILNDQQDKSKQYADFKQAFELKYLEEMTNIPILFKQLIILWFHNESFGNSKTEVYAKMIELLFDKAKERYQSVEQLNKQADKPKFDGKFQGPDSIVSEKLHLPICFKELDEYLYKSLICSLAKLAFHTLFHKDGQMQFVFETHTVIKHGVCKDMIKVCLDIGILTESTVYHKGHDKKSLSFIHKSFHEFFSALYLSVYGPHLDRIESEMGNRCKSVQDIINMKDMFMFLSGMCPPMMKKLSMSCLVDPINKDEKIINYRTGSLSSIDHDNLRMVAGIYYLQCLILKLCQESSDTGHEHSLLLPVPDVEINDSIEDQCHTLADCLHEYPKDVKSFTCLYLRSIRGIISVEYVTDLENHCSIKLRTFDCLSALVLNQEHIDRFHGGRREDKVSIDVSEDQLVSLSGNFVDLRDVSLPNMKATRLRNLRIGPKYRIVGTDAYISHDCMSNLMSVVSQAHSLEYVELSFLRCIDHDSCTDSHCTLDLSRTMRLKKLKLRNISCMSVVFNTKAPYSSLTQISISNLYRHDQIRSLASFTSCAHSIEHIDLCDLKCRHPDNSAVCDCVINLSCHSRLKTLDIYSTSPVLLNQKGPYNYLTDIRVGEIDISHHEMISFMSAVSQAHSLEKIDLTSVRCRDHVTGAQCGYELNFSGHTRLSVLCLGNISPVSLVLNSSDGASQLLKCIRYIIIQNINTLTHDSMTSLKALHDNESSRFTEVHNVKCFHYSNGFECGKCIYSDKTFDLLK